MTLASSVAGRLAELAETYGLDARARGALEALLVLQSEDPGASTTVRDPGDAVDRHVADSLIALEIPGVRSARHVADLGSGAGWPGLALAVALPQAEVSLVESAARRCRYLERAVAAARLANARVVHARAESWPEGIGRHDLVTARALASLPVVFEYAAPLLVLGGVLVAWKAVVPPEEAAAGAAAAQLLGLEELEIKRVRPYPDARKHTLHVLRKATPTPSRFPRRPGMATKHPLSARS